jgi:tRNA threonylcarbamoyladenosine biosynthesis protein TsaB
MKVLAIETATSMHSVAVLEDGVVLARSDERAEGAHAKHLVPTIDRLLQACRLSLADLHGIAVSIGPGSFTGLRVALATALGFRSATGLPIAAVPTLEAMAWHCRDSAYQLCPVIPARAGEVYWAQYQWKADGLHTIMEARVGTLAMLVQSLENPVMVLGEGGRLHRSELRNLLGSRKDRIVDAPGATAPSAVAVGMAGLDRLTRGLVAPPGLAPLYVQRAEADLAWERRHVSP